MDNLFHLANLEKEMAVNSMVRDYEQRMREEVRQANLLKQSVPSRQAWYCCLLVRLGEALVSMGLYLKKRYSLESALNLR